MDIINATGYEQHLKLLQSFLSNDPARAALQLVNIQDGHACATDGHKGIAVKLDILPDGLEEGGTYEIVKLGKSLAFQKHDLPEVSAKPNQAEVFLKCEKNSLKSFDWRINEKSRKNNFHSNSISCLMFRLAEQGICIDYSQLEALPDDTNFNVSFLNARSAVVFKSEQYLIVMMPLDPKRIEEAKITSKEFAEVTA